jgi:amidase
MWIQTQIKRQYRRFSYSGQRTLDFGPFEAALADFTAADAIAGYVTGATIPQIQAHLAAGRLHSEDLTLFYLSRIRAYDVDNFNSMIELNPDALTLARQADAERQDGTVRGPLHGIPVTLKDNIGTGDAMHTSAGAAALRDHISDRDAFIVTRLREAGAVILGKNTLSEWANFMTFESANGFSVLGGQTHNAYGRFDVGGSSSGSAVAVALNFAAAAVGSETAGSLIYPASQNSIVTFKPSLGLISRDRIIPITGAQDTAGPMTRTVTDLAVMLNALAGVDPADALTEAVASIAETDFTAGLDADALRGVRVGVVRREEPPRAGDDAIRQGAVETLNAAGAQVIDIPPLGGLEDINVYGVLLFGFHAGVNAYLHATDALVKTVADIVAFNAADAANRAPYGQTILEATLNFDLNPTMHQLYADLVAANRAAGRASITAALDDHDIAFIVDISNYSTIPYAIGGNPALNLPAGYRESGEPVGVTIIGEWLDDARVVCAGYAFEQANPIRQDPVPQQVLLDA